MGFRGRLTGAFLIACVALAGTRLGLASTMHFSSQSAELPSDDLTFPGSDAVAINGNCLACHSTEMVINQPLLAPADWAAEVKKMINVYKAPVPPGDVPAIVAYLVRTKGKPAPGP